MSHKVSEWAKQVSAKMLAKEGFVSKPKESVPILSCVSSKNSRVISSSNFFSESVLWVNYLETEFLFQILFLRFKFLFRNLNFFLRFKFVSGNSFWAREFLSRVKRSREWARESVSWCDLGPQMSAWKCAHELDLLRFTQCLFLKKHAYNTRALFISNFFSVQKWHESSPHLVMK